MQFFCRNCKMALTPSLQKQDLSLRNETMGEEFLERGTVMLEDGSYFEALTGKYVISIHDVINVRLTDDASRLNGCCGLDGRDGPNLRCSNCEVYVATKMTDCWMPHCVTLEASAVKIEQ